MARSYSQGRKKKGDVSGASSPSHQDQNNKIKSDSLPSSSSSSPSHNKVKYENKKESIKSDEGGQQSRKGKQKQKYQQKNQEQKPLVEKTNGNNELSEEYTWSKSKKKRMRALRGKQQQSSSSIQPQQEKKPDQQEKQQQQKDPKKEEDSPKKVVNDQSDDTQMVKKTKKRKLNNKFKTNSEEQEVVSTSLLVESKQSEQNYSPIEASILLESKQDENDDKTKGKKSNKKRKLNKKIKKELEEKSEVNHTLPKKESELLPSSIDNNIKIESKNNNNSAKPSSTLQNKYQQRLLGSRFRILNEELYTNDSTISYERFQNNPQLFHDYHNGFRYQVQDWTINPIDIIVQLIQSRTIKKQQNKQQSKQNKLTISIADFGCGEAQLAKDLLSYQINDDSNNNNNNDKKYCPFTVHSFDMISPNKYVTACDMANVPLDNETIDIGIFCLALMGTNLIDFINEAYRVIKMKGELIIAEVRSRFFESSSKDNSNNTNEMKKENHNSDSDELQTFINTLKQLGFHCKKIDHTNELFMILELQKHERDNVDNKAMTLTAKPCIYKRR